MTDRIFSERDRKRIEAEGLTLAMIMAQLDLFKKGAFPIRLSRPCTLNDGIRALSDTQKGECLARYDEAAGSGRVMKFVPASGAASRMFQDWWGMYQEEGEHGPEEDLRKFAADLKRFAFFDDLRAVLSEAGFDLETLLAEGRRHDLLDYILTSKGLHYAALPKALLKFHAYPEGSRTALEEHLVEAALYARDGAGVCRLHITVSEEHESLVNDHIAARRAYYERRYGVTFAIGLSVQKSSTNTIAVGMDGQPFRDRTGALVFRPGGHGALLENLSDLDGDIIVVKNIDNVVPDRLKGPTVLYKKILGGYLIGLQRESFGYLGRLVQDLPDDHLLPEAALFCKEKLNIVFPRGYDSMTSAAKKDFLIGKLNRPIRVCGMVRNEGEPGGGPFWIDEKDGTQSLQIIEEAQIDSRSEAQKKTWKSSTYFNPVDLVCGIRDYRSRRFQLKDFVDETSYILAGKSQEGRDMMALELPGLWNGSMANWTTVFVEVPIETFNPVKTVYDFLREQHLPG